MALFDVSDLLVQGANNRANLRANSAQSISSVFDRLAQKKELEKQAQAEFENKILSDPKFAYMNAEAKTQAGIPLSPMEQSAAVAGVKLLQASNTKDEHGRYKGDYTSLFDNLAGAPTPQVMQSQYDAPQSQSVGTLAVRNNNPLNMRPLGQSSGFQKFNTPEDGANAAAKDLEIKISGRSNAMKSNFGEGYSPTLANLISTWAPPSENDTQNYINNVSKDTGIAPNQVLTKADISKLMPAMAKMEGGKLPEARPVRVADGGQIQSDTSRPITIEQFLPEGVNINNASVIQLKLAEKQAEQQIKQNSMIATKAAAAAPKIQRQARRATESADGALAAVNKALNQVAFNTAGVGSMFKALPGSPAVDLSSTLDEIKSLISFGNLSEMKQDSATGASGLGGTTDNEIRLLQSTLGSLEQAQSPKQLRENLLKVKTHYNRLRQEYQKALQSGSNLSPATVAFFEQAAQTPDASSSDIISAEEYFK